MPVHFSTALRTARAQAIADAIDAGAGAGTISLYTGPQPAAGAAITTETLLGTLTCADPCGTVTSGVLTFSVIADDSSADSNGDVVWARIADSGGSWVIDLDVGVTGSGAALEFDTLTAVTGYPIKITGGSITEGNA